MKAGPLRQRVTLQSLTETTDSYGQRVQSWNTLGTYYAEVRQLSGREAVNAKQVKADTTHLVRMRYIGTLFATPGILPSMRFLFNGIALNILFINNVDNRNREYQILAQETVSPVPTS